MDKYLDCYKQDEGESVQSDSSKNSDFSHFDKISLPPNNQLTVSTIVSISDEFNSCQDIESKIGGKYLRENKLTDSTATVNTVNEKVDTEKWYSVTLQIFVPFCLAGLGTIGAGVVLDNVKRYEVFREVKSLFILVPPLLGLKGNLDMCLASRLSTQTNLGNTENRREAIKMIIGNLGLVQIQSIVASCIVSVFALVVSRQFIWEHALILATASTLTATLSCFILDLLLMAVIYISYKMKLNPDNVATPLAASIGDVCSLLLLSSWATLLYNIHDSYSWVMIAILAVYIFILLPIWIFIVRTNKYTKKILTSGWSPVLTALFISGFGGLVLDQAVDKYRDYSIYQPIINGIGGNLVSVHSSRMSTMLHKTSLMGVIPPHTKQWVTPWTGLFMGSKVLPAKTARILLMICIPGHSVFAIVANIISYEGMLTIQPLFLFAYLLVGFVQVICLLYIAHLLVHTLWRYKIDPDNYGIPICTSIGDLLGSVLLFLAFITLDTILEFDVNE